MGQRTWDEPAAILPRSSVEAVPQELAPGGEAGVERRAWRRQQAQTYGMGGPHGVPSAMEREARARGDVDVVDSRRTVGEIGTVEVKLESWRSDDGRVIEDGAPKRGGLAARVQLQGRRGGWGVVVRKEGIRGGSADEV